MASESSIETEQVSDQKAPWESVAERPIEDLPGHWLLARLGKRVLRPGGAAMTADLVDNCEIRGKDVVELAPGLGRTAREILLDKPASYIGIERDPAASAQVGQVVSDYGSCRVGDAEETGLPDASADVVLGEAMLSMQGAKAKDRILQEAHRVLRPCGIYAIHELALKPDDLDPQIATDIRRELARSIKVNVRPLTRAEWVELLESAGFTVERVETAAMALLQPSRVVADEGVLGAMRIIKNIVRNKGARERVLNMRKTFLRNKDSLMAVSIIARRTEVTQ